VRGDVCLQGGAEFGPGCESMDAAMLYRPDVVAGEARRVLVAPFAGRPGRERQVAGANARRWYAGLGATEVDLVLDEGGFAEALVRAELLVLPGGSPARLLEALRPHADALRSAVEGGTAVSGASAGAMVLCRWTALPDAGMRVVPGLGLVPVDLVVVHYRGSRAWLDAAARSLPPGSLPSDALVLGLPERSGAVVGPSGDWHGAGVDDVVQLVV
jgi:cyanophycinase-like exopeptidase